MRKAPRLFKKLTGHELIYQSDEAGYQFYTKLNEFMDISLIMFNMETQTIREFVVDTAIFTSIYQFDKEGKVEAIPMFVNSKGAKPNPVRTLVDKEGYTIIKTGTSKIISSYVLAKVSNFFIDESEYKTLEIKRLVFKKVESSPMIGMDTISIPEFVVPSFLDYMKKVFNKQDLSLEFEGEKDAVN